MMDRLEKVNIDEIMVKRHDADRLLDEAKKKAQDIADSPKIITSSNWSSRK